MKSFGFFAVLGLAVICPIYSVHAEREAVSLERAEGQELSTAVGHYARSRSLLLAAIREFDQGLRHANPDVLIDSAAWRNTLIDRAEDLEKVLAPQPRATTRGIQYTPDSRLLGEAFRK